MGTRPGRRRRRRRRRGGSRLRLVLHPRPPGRAGMRRDRRPEPPRAGVPRRRVRGGGDRQEAGWAIPPRPSHRRSRRVRPRPWERRDRPRRPQREPRQPGCEARRPARGPHASERAAPRARSIDHWEPSPQLLPQVSAFFPVLGWTFFRPSFLGSSRVRSATRQIGTFVAGKPIRKTQSRRRRF